MTLKNTQTRLFHGDTLRYWPKEQRDLLEDVAFEHIKKC